MNISFPASLIRFGRKFAGNETAGSAPIFALAILPLLALVGAAIDFRRAETSQAKLQAELDHLLFRTAAAGEAQFSSAASAEADTLLAPTGGDTVWTVESKQFWTVNSPKGKEFRGTINASVPTTMLALAAIDHMPVSVSSAVLRTTDPSTPCITLVDPTATHALRVNSGAEIAAPGCSVHVMSTANEGAVFNTGPSLDFAEICLRSPGALVNGQPPANLEYSCTPIAPVSQASLPHPSSTACDYNNLNFNGGDIVLQPGVYCGWTNFNSAPNVTLNPGLYTVRNGGWNVNGGQVTGDGVTFYYEDTSVVQFNSATSASLTAPTAGDYQGLLMFEKEGLATSAIILNDTPSFVMQGALYLPSRNATFNSGSQTVSRRMTMVFNTLTLNQTKWQLDPAAPVAAAASEDYAGFDLRLVR